LKIGWKRKRQIPALRFVQLNPRTGEASEFRLLKAEATIGSGEDNQFVIRRSSVSRRHASLAFRKDHCEISDLDSTNGTCVNGKRIGKPTVIEIGDEIRLGDAGLVLAKPVNSFAPANKRLSRAKVLTLRAAFEFSLIAFAIGFGTAQYLAYLMYHARDHLILAEAVPVPSSINSAPPAAEPTPVANQARPSRIESGPVASPEVPVVTEVSPSAMAANADVAGGELAGGVALARLIGGSGTAAGSQAPDFTLGELNGTHVRLDNLRGKIVMLSFWATWCGACRSEMPSLEDLYRSFRSYHDFLLLTVNIDKGGGVGVTQFMTSNGYDFPVMLDPGNATGAAYEVRAIPSTFVIGRGGRIIWNGAGALNWSDPRVRRALKALL
jgi:peroxiredoxin